MPSVWTTPKVWAVGDPATSPELNTYIRDNLTYLNGLGSWTALGLTAPWTNLNAAICPALAYTRKGNYVWLRGIVATGNMNTNLATLPAGYAPLMVQTFMSWGSTGGTSQAMVISIATTGIITVGVYQGLATAVAYVSLDNISFAVDVI